MTHYWLTDAFGTTKKFKSLPDLWKYLNSMKLPLNYGPYHIVKGGTKIGARSQRPLRTNRQA